MRHFNPISARGTAVSSRPNGTVTNISRHRTKLKGKGSKTRKSGEQGPVDRARRSGFSDNPTLFRCQTCRIRRGDNSVRIVDYADEADARPHAVNHLCEGIDTGTTAERVNATAECASSFVFPPLLVLILSVFRTNDASPNVTSYRVHAGRDDISFDNVSGARACDTHTSRGRAHARTRYRHWRAHGVRASSARSRRVSTGSPGTTRVRALSVFIVVVVAVVRGRPGPVEPNTHGLVIFSTCAPYVFHARVAANNTCDRLRWVGRWRARRRTVFTSVRITRGYSRSEFDETRSWRARSAVGGWKMTTRFRDADACAWKKNNKQKSHGRARDVSDCPREPGFGTCERLSQDSLHGVSLFEIIRRLML